MLLIWMEEAPAKFMLILVRFLLNVHGFSNVSDAIVVKKVIID